MLLTTILTAPRPNGVEYLTQTLAAIRKQTEPVIFTDSQKTGNRASMRETLAYFVARRDFSRLLYLEDDVLPCRNLIEYAQAVEIPEHWPLLSLFDARVADQRNQRLEMNAHTFFYTQALIIPRQTAIKLLTTDWTGRTSLQNGNGCSRQIRRSLTELGHTTYGLQTPNPIKHTGQVSAILQRVSLVPESQFIGEDFNATTLI